MISLSEFTITKEEIKDNEFKFTFTPLPQGYGHNIGNLMRRVLLSSVPGSAVTSVKIKGAQHEYSTIEGVADDTLTVLLNLKNIVILGKTEDKVEITLKTKGKKGQVTEVKAGDFDKNADVEIMNPDYVITTLTDDVDFELVATVERNVGYKLPDEKVREQVGVLPVDAIFSPVVNVKYEVQPTRVGQKSELDELVMSVKTNGAITPSDALSIASSIVNDMASSLVQQTEDMISGKVLTSVPTEEIGKSSQILSDDEEEEDKSILVSDLGLSTRLTNALLRSGFDDLRKLEGFTVEEVENIRGMGEKSLVELKETLKDKGVKLI